MISNGALMTEHSGSTCPVCLSTETRDYFSLHDVPTQDGVLWATHEEAIAAPRGDIDLSLCSSCGYIWNRSHDPSKVHFVGYDVSLQHSPIFQTFTRSLVERLVERYGLHQKTVLDIGCGKGYFLRTICAAGGNKGIGFDPSYSDDGAAPDPSLTFVKDYYSEQFAAYTAELVSCRHVVDILGDPLGFVKMVRRNIGTHASIVYFESPFSSYTFKNAILWNLVYEHKSWFTLDSYAALFEHAGFDVIATARCWNDEYISIEAAPRAGTPAPRPRDRASIDESARDLTRFADEAKTTIASWTERLDALRRSGKRAAAWGAGARAISWLNLFDLKELVPTVVDINPKRHGKYLPITAHKVETPETLLSIMPDVLFITNPTYEKEIRDQSRALGFAGEYIVL
jgi:SAM-dependent methyltransferase